MMKTPLIIAAAAIGIGLAACGSSSPAATPGSPQDLCNTLRKNDTSDAAGEWAVHRMAQGDTKEKVFSVSEEAKSVCPDLTKNIKNSDDN
jgi:hypothetical protein